MDSETVELTRKTSQSESELGYPHLPNLSCQIARFRGCIFCWALLNVTQGCKRQCSNAKHVGTHPWVRVSIKQSDVVGLNKQ